MNEPIDSSRNIFDLSSRFSDISNVLSPVGARQELEEKIKIWQPYFSQKDSTDAVDSDFKAPHKRITSSYSSQNNFGNSTNAMPISDYYHLLFKDNVCSTLCSQVIQPNTIFGLKKSLS